MGNKIINGFCYKYSDKIIFIDLITERTTNYRFEEFEKFFTSENIDETFIVLSNKDGGFLTPLFKSSCLTYLKKSKKNRMCDFTKDEMIDICYDICISLQKNLEG
jgi:hypothetical protein